MYFLIRQLIFKNVASDLKLILNKSISVIFPSAGLFVIYWYGADRKDDISAEFENLDRFLLSKKDLFFQNTSTK